MKKVFVLYIPVLHAGYLKFLRKHKDKTEVLYILGNDFIEELMPLHKEIRALDPRLIKKFVETLDLFKQVRIISRESLKELKKYIIITAREEISRKFVNKYLPQNRVFFEPVFLRWDEKKVQSIRPVRSKNKSNSSFDKKMMACLQELSEASPDWWRQVGAVIVKNKKVLLETYNKHVPFEQQPYIDGDPRDFIEAGKSPELSTSFHSEQALIAEAARRGIRLEGTSIYVSAFPCPVCAKLIAYAGIKKCFFIKGSATLDGENILRANKVEIINLK